MSNRKKATKAMVLMSWLLICLILCLLWANYELARELEEVKQELSDEKFRFYELERLYHELTLRQIPSREGTR